MNAEKIVKELRWLSENDEWVFAAETMAKAADIIESLQAQFAESQRRERAAVEDLKSACLKAGGPCGETLCTFCANFNHFEPQKPWLCNNPCDDAEGWRWRGDAEEGENE